ADSVFVGRRVHAAGGSSSSRQRLAQQSDQAGPPSLAETNTKAVVRVITFACLPRIAPGPHSQSAERLVQDPTRDHPQPCRGLTMRITMALSFPRLLSLRSEIKLKAVFGSQPRKKTSMTTSSHDDDLRDIAAGFSRPPAPGAAERRLDDARNWPVLPSFSLLLAAPELPGAEPQLLDDAAVGEQQDAEGQGEQQDAVQQEVHLDAPLAVAGRQRQPHDAVVDGPEHDTAAIRARMAAKSQVLRITRVPRVFVMMERAFSGWITTM
uniref:Ovate family protein n=1 Tax=Macrostomum lignano TaxID=282301 RepID=A0A1I8FMK0_9PLAT